MIYLRLLRREFRRLQQQVRYRRWSLIEMPILFCNSFPKSGTHLLTQILGGFMQLGAVVESGLPAVVTFNSINGEQRPESQILEDLKRFKPADIGYGHLHATQAIMNWLCRDGVIPYFILRDPRDVVVSHVHYITNMASTHIHHRYYTEGLHSFEDRLRISILGRDTSFPSIADRFLPFVNWMEKNEVLTLRYEEFLRDRRTTLRKVIDHALQRGFVLSANTSMDQAVIFLEQAINPQRSPTFRQGKARVWKDAFTPESTALFKDIASDLLIRLGYEKDNNW